MRCPSCNSLDTQVKDSRPTEDSAVIRRRRVCIACNFRFTTFERVQLRELVFQNAEDHLRNVATRASSSPESSPSTVSKSLASRKLRYTDAKRT